MKLLQKALFLNSQHRNKCLGDQNKIGLIKLEIEKISNSESVHC